MAKKSDVTLLSPPRYPRHDPRNKQRMAAGHLLSMQLGGYDYPIRRLRQVGDVQGITLPPQVRNSLDIKRGDWLMFGQGPWPGCAWMCKVTDSEYQNLSADKGVEFRRKARKVRGDKYCFFVTVAPAVRKILSAEVGDSLTFGLPAQYGVISVSAVKGGNGSAGRRRPG